VVGPKRWSGRFASAVATTPSNGASAAPSPWPTAALAEGGGGSVFSALCMTEASVPSNGLAPVSTS
jgi:hypothetical protein